MKRLSTHGHRPAPQGTQALRRAHRARDPEGSRSNSCWSAGSGRDHALLAHGHERKEIVKSFENSDHVSSDAPPVADLSDLEFRYRMGAFENLGSDYLLFKGGVINCPEVPFP